jgi:hypothetical protein
MDREEEISNMKMALERYISENIPGYEVHLFESDKQEKRKKALEIRLPPTDPSSRIKKSNAWIVWICDENSYIIDLQVYDLRLDVCPYKREQIVNFIEAWSKNQKPIISYSDCGCLTKGWDEWKLQDIYFKFGIQYGFINRNIMIQSLKRFSCIEEFGENIKQHLDFLE